MEADLEGISVLEEKYMNIVSNRTGVSLKQGPLINDVYTQERRELSRIEEKYLKMEEESLYKSNFN